MHLKKIFVISMVLFTAVTDAQQNISLYVPRNLQATYDKGTRTTSGEPGKDYWQNSANYTITVNFDPVTRLVSGNEDILYTNNSPDTLKQVWFKLYPNLYKKGNIRESQIQPQDISDGVHISFLSVNDNRVDSNRIRSDGTNLTIPVNPILPGKMTRFSIYWSYTLNKHSNIRTGEVEPGADFIAYFFPRIAVYDDIDGWNRYPYVGTQEFYNDFCNFNVSVKVPVNFLVWATGDLNNCNEVLAEKYCQRLQAAGQSDGITTIVDTADLVQKNITMPNSSNTWKFSASGVTDFVFAVSDHYIWKSSSLVVDKSTNRRTRVDAVFNQKHKDYFEVVDFARKTVWAMSYVFPNWPYPYQHETVFDGTEQMEYPMMVNDNPEQNRVDGIELTDHEIFHTMFPFYMGINETKYGWMDEGWATIGEWLISPIIDSSVVDEYTMSAIDRFSGVETDLPIMTLTTELSAPLSNFLNSYGKPGLGYLYVKDLLGDTLWNKSLHYYINQWHGKHPMPFDFFYCMNTGSGRNLNWFWKRWFFDNGVPDLGITKVDKTSDGYVVSVQCKGIKPVPVDLVVDFRDGTQSKLHRSIGVWENSDVAYVSFKSSKEISKISLGSTYTADVDKKDNVWFGK
jgi:hypothetical protein